MVFYTSEKSLIPCLIEDTWIFVIVSAIKLLFTMLFWMKYMKKTNLHRYVLKKQKYFGSLYKITVIFLFDTKQAVISKELATM